MLGNILRNDFAIDFGLYKSRIYLLKHGFVFNDLSLAHFYRNDNSDVQLLKIGKFYKFCEVEGQEKNFSLNPFLHSPNHASVPNARLIICKKIIMQALADRHFYHKFSILRTALIGIRDNCEESDIEVIRECVKTLGMQNTIFVSNSVAAALGSGYGDLFGEFLLINLGHLSTTVTFISNGKVIDSSAVPYCIVDIFIRHLQDVHCLHIERQSAEHYLRAISNLNELTALGIDTQDKIVKKVTMNFIEFRDIIQKSLHPLINEIHKIVDEIPSFFTNSVPLIISGGGANCELMNTLIRERLNIMTSISDDPQHDTINGLRKICNLTKADKMKLL